MSAAPQFIACKFREEDSRSYTYRNDGAPISVGDIVVIPDRRGDGLQKLFVVGIVDEAPPFECKPILGLDVATELDLGDDDDFLASRAA